MSVWLKYIHVLAALTFFLAHGASASMAFRIKKERDLARIRAMLDLSGASFAVFGLSLLVLLAAGIAGGFVGHWWKFGWIWVSLGLFLAISIWMGIYSRRVYHPLRKAAGMPYMEGNKEMPAVERASDAEIAALLEGTNPALVAGVSYGLLAVILWLMIFKPF